MVGVVVVVSFVVWDEVVYYVVFGFDFGDVGIYFFDDFGFFVVVYDWELWW